MTTERTRAPFGEYYVTRWELPGRAVLVADHLSIDAARHIASTDDKMTITSHEHDSEHGHWRELPGLWRGDVMAHASAGIGCDYCRAQDRNPCGAPGAPVDQCDLPSGHVGPHGWVLSA